MLEARSLYKEYKTKNGPVVKALDDVSIKFEETGMVFILGKSGSGKSTLLNVLGGLDKYDSGEVIVKGKSSKDFSQADFDSYRNTFVGFIFQDYNILEEFTISKNIGLALELQGKKADKNAINELMEQVDLKGYGNRKPNTLSGGQRQRVAIARALVKNPEIIMADEPTGALDSATGKQVFDTLKKLSKTKLVLIVSHDREFAEYYGDRIIELADGKIISDVRKYKTAPKESDGLEIVDDKILTIKKGTKLDSKKAKTLIDFIVNNDEDIIVSIDKKANKEFKKFAMIDDEGNKESFKITEGLNIKEYNPDDFKLIRSKLPGKDSFKMGASGLKSKPIRLFFTIILSAIAFAMFGLADTMGSYDKVENTIRSIMDSNINYATFSKSYGITSSGSDYVYYRETMLSKDDFTNLNSELDGYNFIPVFNLNNEYNSSYSFSNNLYETDGIGYDSLYKSVLYGFVEASDSVVNQFGTLLDNSRLPNNDEEIIITKYTYDVFAKGGYTLYSGNTKVEINSVSDLLGKKINLYGDEFTIVGVLDTNFDMSRYSRMEDPGFGESMSDYMLKQEYNELISKSAHALGYLNEGWFANNRLQTKFNLINDTLYFSIKDEKPSTDSNNAGIRYLTRYTDDMINDIIWKNSSKNTLADDEAIITADALNQLELEINGSKYQYNELVGKECINNYIYKGIEQILSNDPNTSEYSSWDVKNWYDNDWREYANYANLSLTDAQKSEIENFIDTANPTYCIDIDAYFEIEDVKAKLEEQYNARVDAGTDIWGSYSTYIYDLTHYLTYGYYPYGNTYRTATELQIIKDAQKYIISNLSNNVPDYIWISYYGKNNEDYYNNPRKFKVVGYYTGLYTDSSDTYNRGIISNVLYDEFKDTIGGIYNFAISTMDYTNEDMVRKVVNYTYGDFGNIKYELKNPVMTSMEEINDMIESLSKVFLYVGIGFAVFASLLLLNFITISISYKKREIGVLRAIGARGRDVFKIFFNEAFIIAFINFVLATIGCFAVCMILNNTIRNDYGMLITILNMGVRQVLLMFVVSLLVAFLSSFLPVYKIARKKPIDAIRNS